MDKRKWRITIGGNHYWLTDDEQQYYLKALENGQQYVAFPSGKILSGKFLDIVSINVLAETEKIDSGKWECESGKWHNGECFCKNTFAIEGNMAKVS